MADFSPAVDDGGEFLGGQLGGGFPGEDPGADVGHAEGADGVETRFGDESRHHEGGDELFDQAAVVDGDFRHAALLQQAVNGLALGELDAIFQVENQFAHFHKRAGAGAVAMSDRVGGVIGGVSGDLVEREDGDIDGWFWLGHDVLFSIVWFVFVSNPYVRVSERGKKFPIRPGCTGGYPGVVVFPASGLVTGGGKSGTGGVFAKERMPESGRIG